MTCRSALNRPGGTQSSWTLNPYNGCAHRCTFCYVRTYERRADRPSDERYGRTVRVKTNVAEILRRELERPGWRRQDVTVGAATDPYQPAEARYRLTRRCLELLGAFRTPLALITRSTLVVRDRDVIADAARGAGAKVHFSICTLDEDVWRRTEPGTPPPRQRLRALSLLAAAGIPAGVGIAPVLPGLTDGQASLAAVVQAARDAGAAHLWWDELRLRPGTREHFLECLARHWPEQLPRYRRLYAGRSSLPREEVGALEARVAEARRPFPLRPPDLIEPSNGAEQLALGL